MVEVRNLTKQIRSRGNSVRGSGGGESVLAERRSSRRTLCRCPSNLHVLTYSVPTGQLKAEVTRGKGKFGHNKDNKKPAEGRIIY